jgi:hypothetical protein
MNKRSLKNKFLQVEYLTNSLRVSGIIPAGKPNLLVDLSDLAPVPTPYGDYYFHGGHRLWHAPEVLPRTYIPDDGEIAITDITDGVILEGKTEPGSGIRKRIEIRLAADKPTVVLTHTLINDGLWPVKLAPWAITMLCLGGTAIMPLPLQTDDPFTHDRHISMWTYASFKDPRLVLDDRYVLFKANALLPAFKMGSFSPHGWMAYWVNGVLFRKSFEVQTGVEYPDNNCNVELYCNDRMVELETLAPFTTLAPGASASHVETWEIFNNLDVLPEDVKKMLSAL